MPTTLVLLATAGHANANSYATVAEADLYFVHHPEWEKWDRLYTNEKSRNLILATTQIDMLCIDGVKYNDTLTLGVPNQALKFPRSVDVSGATVYIPMPVKKACYEQAIYIAGKGGGGTSTRAQLQAEGVTRITIGDVTEEYGSGDTGGSSQSHELCTRAYQTLVDAGYISMGMSWA